jgi:hypothetical protein
MLLIRGIRAMSLWILFALVLHLSVVCIGQYLPKKIALIISILLCYYRGITVGAALQSASFEGTVESVDKLKYDPASVWGYVEVSVDPQ